MPASELRWFANQSQSAVKQNQSKRDYFRLSTENLCIVLFSFQVIKQVSSSSIKSFLFNLAMRSKKAELERLVNWAGLLTFSVLYTAKPNILMICFLFLF